LKKKNIFWLTALLVLFVMFHSNILATVENHNSSRSNKSYPIAPVSLVKDTFLIYNTALISNAQGDNILNELVKQPVQKINVQRVRAVLNQNAIKGVNSIIIEPVPGTTGLLIYLLKKANDKNDAKKNLKTGKVK